MVFQFSQFLMSLKETGFLLNETVLCLGSAQQLVNFTTVSRWIALTSQDRFIIFDGQNELESDTVEHNVQKRESLVQKAILRSRKVSASSDGGDEPPIKASPRPTMEAIGELANDNGNEYSMSSIKSSESHQEYTNAECQVDVFERPKIKTGTERLTANPRIADTDVNFNLFSLMLRRVLFLD